MTTSSKIQAARFHRERFGLTGDCAPLVIGHIQRSAIVGRSKGSTSGLW